MGGSAVDDGTVRTPRAPALGAVGVPTISVALVLGVAAAVVLARTAGGPHPVGSLPAFLWAVAGGWLAAAGVLLAVTDLRTHRLPDRLLVAAAVVAGPLLVVAALADGTPVALLRAAAGALVPAGVLYVLALLSPGAVGLGDVKLLLVLGAWLGHLSVAAAGAGPVLGVVLGGLVALLAVLTGRAGLRSHLPLGPALVAGAALATALECAGAL